MTQLRSIYLDMDDTLVDLSGGVLSLYGVDKARRMEISSWDGILPIIRRYADPSRVPPDTAAMWADIGSRGAAFWADLEWLPWGRELLAACQNTALTVLMSTPTRDPASAQGKLLWMQRHMSPTGSRMYALTPCKHLMAHEGAMLIDDNQRNIDAFARCGGGTMLLPAPWNDEGYTPTTTDVIDRFHKAVQ